MPPTIPMPTGGAESCGRRGYDCRGRGPRDGRERVGAIVGAAAGREGALGVRSLADAFARAVASLIAAIGTSDRPYAVAGEQHYAHVRCQEAHPHGLHNHVLEARRLASLRSRTARANGWTRRRRRVHLTPHAGRPHAAPARTCGAATLPITLWWRLRVVLVA